MRSIHKHNVLILFLVFVIICMLSILVYRMFSVERINYPHDSYVGPSISIYFMPSDAGVSSVFSALTDSQKSISCVFRSLNFEELETLLEQKEAEGVKVRLFVDKDYMGNKRIYLPYVRFSDEGYSMMHANYCIVDEKIVITGSTIFNNNTIAFNFHDTVIINSSQLADEFSSHFWYLYNNQSKNDSFNSSPVVIGDSTVTPYFCPLDNCARVYVDAIDSAQHNISFAMYAFTNPDVIAAIKRAQGRGVVIRGVVESQGMTASSIISHHLPGIKKDVFNRRIHTKLLVVDGKISITGSLNPSVKGVTFNDEVILVIEDTNIALFYADYVEYLFEYVKIL